MARLSAVSDAGKAVDWWFMYKIAGKSKTADGKGKATANGKPVTGVEYIYFDANAPATGKLVLSKNDVTGPSALKNSLDQVYAADASKSPDIGWVGYNDEDPTTGKTTGSLGHTKGVLAFDLKTNSGFWLVQSTPLFPVPKKYSFPKTGLPNAQTLLCITLKDADTAKSIAHQMLAAQRPQIYWTSKIPAQLAKEPTDPRVRLIQKDLVDGSTPLHCIVPFLSQGGVKFMSIAKNAKWGLDFYQDLVGPTLHENIEVETWEHDPVPQHPDSDKKHTVAEMKEVDLASLGVDIAWSEESDHGKLAISAASEKDHFVCVGDINFTIAQRKRSGGTVAFQNEALWKSLFGILRSTTTFGEKPAKKTAAKRAAAGA